MDNTAGRMDTDTANEMGARAGVETSISENAGNAASASTNELGSNKPEMGGPMSGRAAAGLCVEPCAHL
jgi:hypothetical protein